MDLLAEYASVSESSSSTSDGNECETVNTDKDLNAGAVRQVYLVMYRKKFHLRCFDTVFLGPYLTFKIGS